jgi:dihydrofolate synthase/folylpolyglutamate synthase
LPDWLATLEARHPRAIELGLDRVGRAWRSLGVPAGFQVITVAGTNGKGSVCAFLDAMLTEAGYRVGLYTSPHLLRFNERIRLAGKEADDRAIVEALAAVESARGDTPLTYFEHTTLAALWLFCRQGVDAAVLEVGLGGRLDAVNVLDADCAVVTPVDLDHMDYLGSDRESIGFEKAGIFRPGRPAVCIDPEPPASLLAHARAIGARLLRLGRELTVEVAADDWLCRVDDRVFPALPRPAMAGRYQYHNAAAAIAALDQLRSRLPVPMAAVRAGVARAVVPGRFQVVGHAPLRILDVGHNPHAARALAANLAAMPRSGRRLAVFAMLADKDAAGVIDSLAGQIDHWLVAGLDGARARPAAGLAELLAARGLSHAQYADVGAAWRAACEEAMPPDTIACFGSFHTVAEVMALISGSQDG